MLCVDVKCLMIVPFASRFNASRTVCVRAATRKLSRWQLWRTKNKLEILPFAAEEAINCKLLDLLFRRKEYGSN